MKSCFILHQDLALLLFRKSSWEQFKPPTSWSSCEYLVWFISINKLKLMIELRVIIISCGAGGTFGEFDTIRAIALNRTKWCWWETFVEMRKLLISLLRLAGRRLSADDHNQRRFPHTYCHRFGQRRPQTYDQICISIKNFASYSWGTITMIILLKGEVKREWRVGLSSSKRDKS